MIGTGGSDKYEYRLYYVHTHRSHFFITLAAWVFNPLSNCITPAGGILRYTNWLTLARTVHVLHFRASAYVPRYTYNYGVAPTLSFPMSHVPHL